MMSMTRIKTLLSQRIGIDATTVSAHHIERAVKHRLTACGLPDLTSYLELLQTSSPEFTELVEQIVVPETYFFRDSKSFTFLIDFIRSEWLSKSHKSKLRLLSIPCSTGEEAYSMAIAMMEAGLTTDRFQIDAIDISDRALAKAQRGVYGKNSFRGADFIDRSKYFQQTIAGYELSTSIRSTVNFSKHNILDKSAFDRSNYDIIFCRNLLIYLNPAACESVFDLIHQLLNPQGLLFVASAETAKVPKHHFTAIRQASTFVYQKNAADRLNQNIAAFDRKLKFISPPAPQTIQPMAPVNRLANISTNSTKSTQATTIEIDRNLTNLDLKIARQLGDEGQLDRAIEYCQQYLKIDRANIEAYLLIAMLYQGKNENNLAEKHFQKALYLDPNCHEALVYLALLKEHKGDVVGAKIIKQRIQNTG
jgi:chemotaxis protein methyltransferase WspC